MYTEQSKTAKPNAGPPEGIDRQWSRGAVKLQLQSRGTEWTKSNYTNPKTTLGIPNPLWQPWHRRCALGSLLHWAAQWGGWGREQGRQAGAREATLGQMHHLCNASRHTEAPMLRGKHNSSLQETLPHCNPFRRQDASVVIWTGNSSFQPCLSVVKNFQELQGCWTAERSPLGITQKAHTPVHSYLGPSTDWRSSSFIRITPPVLCKTHKCAWEHDPTPPLPCSPTASPLKAHVFH